MAAKKPTRMRAARPRFTLTSSDLRPNGTLSMEQVFNGFDLKGQDVSPALAWTNAPERTPVFRCELGLGLNWVENPDWSRTSQRDEAMSVQAVREAVAQRAGAVDVVPMAIHIGAEIHGVDLSRPLPPEHVSAIRAALLRWKVVFFRDHEARVGPSFTIESSGNHAEIAPVLQPYMYVFGFENAPLSATLQSVAELSTEPRSCGHGRLAGLSKRTSLSVVSAIKSVALSPEFARFRRRNDENPNRYLGPTRPAIYRERPMIITACVVPSH